MAKKYEQKKKELAAKGMPDPEVRKNVTKADRNAELGFDSKKRWGNSAMKGHGVNSPAMMEARKKFAHNKK